MKVLALDFDGVVCDSIRETFATAVRTYSDFVPDSTVWHRIQTRLGSWPWSESAIVTDPDFFRFEALVPLGNRAEDFGVALLAMDLELQLDDQEAYDAFYRSLDPTWLESFHRGFYESRDTARGENPEAWLALHLDYPALTAVLRRIAARVSLAVATAKDGPSLGMLLTRFGLSDLFPKELRLDKETGVQKTEHLTRLAERTGVGFEDITFIDDKVNHLARVAPLGVRPVLAGWGHNTEREHRTAVELGFQVASLDSVESVVFGGEAS